MKVYRETQTEAEHIRIGDKIDIEIDKKTWKATAVQRDGNRVLFVTDEVIGEHRMNPEDTTKGGYEACEMRKYLDELTKTIPDEILNVMQPDSLGDHLWLLSLQEVRGIDEDWNKTDGQIEWFKDRRHRVAPHNGKDAGWWLRSVTSASDFAGVHDGGNAAYIYASVPWVGVRPAFAIFDPESPSLVDGDTPENKAREEINDKTGDMNTLYSLNEDFRAYVDKYMAKEQIGLQTALSHRIVRNYAEYLMERGAKEIELPNMWGGAGAAHENMADI